jgi:hypothetical protein
VDAVQAGLRVEKRVGSMQKTKLRRTAKKRKAAKPPIPSTVLLRCSSVEPSSASVIDLTGEDTISTVGPAAATVSPLPLGSPPLV